jgi:hypothetical protein
VALKNYRKFKQYNILLLKGDKVNAESEHAGRGVQGTITLQSKGCITVIMR